MYMYYVQMLQLYYMLLYFIGLSLFSYEVITVILLILCDLYCDGVCVCVCVCVCVFVHTFVVCVYSGTIFIPESLCPKTYR